VVEAAGADDVLRVVVLGDDALVERVVDDADDHGAIGIAAEGTSR
jgi:hypothetical protein